MTRPNAKNDLRCPNCGSHYTQYLPTCFSLTRQSGLYTPKDNEFHKLIQRPERRSVFVLPVSVFLGISYFGTLGREIYLMETRPSWVLKNSWASPEALIPALLLGTVCGLILWARAWNHNHEKFPGEYEIWLSSAICRRCSSKFRAPAGIVEAYKKQTL